MNTFKVEIIVYCPGCDAEHKVEWLTLGTFTCTCGVKFTVTHDCNDECCFDYAERVP